MAWLIALLQPPLPAPPSHWETPEIIDRKPPVLYLVVDDSRESKLLLSELDRDWTAYSTDCDSYLQLRKLNELRSNMWLREIVVIKYDDSKACDKHRIDKDFTKYPVYRFNREELQHFPSQMFATPTWCLKTVDALTNRYHESRKKYLWYHREEVHEHHREVVKYSRQFVAMNCLEQQTEFNRDNWVYWSLSEMGEYQGYYGTSYYGRWGPNPELLQQQSGYNPPELNLPYMPNDRFEWE
jgi:hypothetical protein